MSEEHSKSKAIRASLLMVEHIDTAHQNTAIALEPLEFGLLDFDSSERAEHSENPTATSSDFEEMELAH